MLISIFFNDLYGIVHPGTFVVVLAFSEQTFVLKLLLSLGKTSWIAEFYIGRCQFLKMYNIG